MTLLLLRANTRAQVSKVLQVQYSIADRASNEGYTKVRED